MRGRVSWVTRVTGHKIWPTVSSDSDNIFHFAVNTCTYFLMFWYWNTLFLSFHYPAVICMAWSSWRTSCTRQRWRQRVHPDLGLMPPWWFCPMLASSQRARRVHHMHHKLGNKPLWSSAVAAAATTATWLSSKWWRVDIVWPQSAPKSRCPRRTDFAPRCLTGGVTPPSDNFSRDEPQHALWTGLPRLASSKLTPTALRQSSNVYY